MAGEETGCEEDETGGYPPLRGICESVANDWEKWVSWADGDVWESPTPGGFFDGDGEGRNGGASAFQRLVLVKAFREDQLLRCIAKFVGEKLGNAFAER